MLRLPFLFLAFGSAAHAFLQTPTRRAFSRSSTITLQAAAKGVQALTDTNFRSLFNGDKPVLIDAYAPWCGPCKLMEPVVERCVERHSDWVVVAGFDVESSETKELKIELLLQGAMPKALPTLIMVHKGKAIAAHKGLISDEELDDFISDTLVTREMEKSNAATVQQNGDTKKAGLISFTSNPVDGYMLSER